MDKRFIYFLLIGMISWLHTWPQPSKMEMVKQGMDYIYNCEFEKSQSVIDRIEKKLPGSAIPDLMKAMQVFWQNYPVFLVEGALLQYQEHLEGAYQRSFKVLENDPGNHEAIFLAMAAQGLLAESYAESGRSFRAVGAAKRAYNYIKDGSNRKEQFKEFYLSTGLYNYYREYYPEAHPIYKPFMYFFMKGDKQTGIKQLEYAARNTSIAHVFAKYYLSYIYLRYEYIPAKALRQGKDLHQSYPDNKLFTSIYIESLIMNKKYGEAKPLAQALQADANPYLSIYGNLFMAVIEELKHKNYSKAEELYKLALRSNDKYEMEQYHMEAYAYLGLGRIYQLKNEQEQARKFFKESLDKAYTEAMKKEAKSYLN
jgi:tetratricopeptide (TPR) repeat protein